MITGDNIRTAKAVAKSVGIAPEKEVPVGMTGVELDRIDDDELYKVVPDVDVYARVAPEHKFRIIKQLQKRGNISAMTGDGVNDAPALKQADIGVAMGSGTDVAKEAASMVLMDDNFAIIVNAVRRGRIVLENLKHIIMYILSTSFGGLLTIATSVMIGFPLPMLAAQLLWVNLVTDGTSTFPLAFEKEHGNVMVFPPRKRKEPLVQGLMIFRMIISGIIMMLGTLFIFYYYNHLDGVSAQDALDKARTMAFCTLAFFQIWNVQNSRSMERSLFFKLPFSKNEKYDRIGFTKNRILFGVMFLAIFLQVIAVELPFMNTLLKTVNIDWIDWLVVISVSFSIIIFIEIEKWIEAVLNRKKNYV
jgi:Ca2+-transporting ATPase